MSKKTAYKPPVSGVDYNVPIPEAIKRAKDVNDFYKLISYDTSFQEYRNSIFDEYRIKYIKPISDSGPYFGGLLDVLRLEDHLDEKLFGHTPTQEQKDSMSVYEKCVKVYSVEYAEAWKNYLTNSNWAKYLCDRYDELVIQYKEIK